jgi:plasmid stabilization system protein ParE
MVIAPRAAQDLKEVFDFVALDNEIAAQALLKRIERRIGMLRQHPLLALR